LASAVYLTDSRNKAVKGNLMRWLLSYFEFNFKWRRMQYKYSNAPRMINSTRQKIGFIECLEHHQIICYKTYTSKHNCRPFTQLEENEDTGSIPDSAVIQTWSVVQPGSIDSSLILEIRQSKATSWADCSVTLNSTLSGIECNKNLLMPPEW
jgi:hypothetical protein